MVAFKMHCPDCGAVVITASPDAVLLECCPGCKVHVWDRYDALMADVDMTREYGGVACFRNA